MEARLESNWPAATWRIWILDRGGPRGIKRVAGPIPPSSEEGFSYPHEWTELTENAAPRPLPTLELPEDFLQAIVTAGNEEAGLVAPDRAMAAHLSDAREMRDRLLGMVERGFETHPLDGGYVVSIRPPE